MGLGVADMMVYRGSLIGVHRSAMGLELFLGNIMGNFCQEFLAISRTPPHAPLSKVDGTPVL